jgi:hypothetical protein
MQQNETYVKQLGKMTGPIPGQSLTSDPENPAPYEQAPEFTKKAAALQSVFINSVKEEVYVPMMQALVEGTTVMEMTQVILFEGFRQGKWNPDLFMLLVEPTAYIIMALAERAEVEYEIDRDGEEPDPDSEIAKKFNSIGDGISKGGEKPGVVPAEIKKQIAEMPAPESMVKRPEPKPEMAANEESLITKRV